MQETVIAGTELKLTARIENETLTVQWDKMPQRWIFIEGYAAILRLVDGMIELQRVAVEADGTIAGYVEPLLDQRSP